MDGILGFSDYPDYWIPMNAIFKHLSLEVDTSAFPIIFELKPA